MTKFISAARLRLAVAVLIVSGALLPTLAKDDPKWDVGLLLGAGFGDQALVGPEKDSDPNLLVGVRGGFFFHPQFQVFSDATLTSYKSDLLGGKTTEEQAVQ